MMTRLDSTHKRLYSISSINWRLKMLFFYPVFAGVWSFSSSRCVFLKCQCQIQSIIFIFPELYLHFETLLEMKVPDSKQVTFSSLTNRRRSGCGHASVASFNTSSCSLGLHSCPVKPSSSYLCTMCLFHCAAPSVSGPCKDLLLPDALCLVNFRPFVPL